MGNIRRMTKCGGFGCQNLIEFWDGDSMPAVPICKLCEQRFNRGIVEYLHANTGHAEGGFHVTDGYTPQQERKKLWLPPSTQ